MASLALGLVGAAVGGSLIEGTILGMSGAALGFAVGSSAGNMLFSAPGSKVNQEGPRLSDLEIMTATFGAHLPHVYGRARVTGNVIWAKPIQEVSHTERSGGGKKGGKGGTTVKTTTYTYYGTFAVAICEGPVAGWGGSGPTAR